MKNIISTLHFLDKGGLKSWLIWYAGMLLLIAGMLAMYFIKAAAFLETPLSLLTVVLMIHFFEKMYEN